MKKNRKLIALLLSLNMLLFTTSCSKNTIDFDDSIEVIADDLDETERNILLNAESFVTALTNYNLNKNNANRVCLVKETRSMINLALEMMKYKLNCNSISYSVGDGGESVTLKIDNSIYSGIDSNSPIFFLFSCCNNLDFYKGDGSNKEKWTDSVTNAFIQEGIELYNYLLLQSAYDYEIEDNKIIISSESDNIKKYKKSLR